MSFFEKMWFPVKYGPKGLWIYLYIIYISNNMKQGPELLKNIKLSFAFMFYPWKVLESLVFNIFWCRSLSFPVFYWHINVFVRALYVYTAYFHVTLRYLKKFLQMDYSISCISSFEIISSTFIYWSTRNV